MSKPVVVIGVGVEGLASLTSQARKHLKEADQVWGSECLLALLPVGGRSRQVVMATGIPAGLEHLKSRGERARIVLLASGDPGFFGLGGTLLKILPPEEVRLVPQVNFLQTAFARAGLARHDTYFTSAHARPLAEVIGYARRFRQLAILTDRQHSPASLAASLLAAGIHDCRAIVCENLGEADEAVVDSRLSALVERDFADLSVLIVAQADDWLPPVLETIRLDGPYVHPKGLITLAEFWALCLSRLTLRETDMVWDIGAGNGYISIEMAKQVWRSRVFAVEKDPWGLVFLHQNLARWGVPNVVVVAGEAPAALADLPAPDAVYIGGCGRQLEATLRQVVQAALPGCRLAATFTRPEKMLQARQWLRRAGWHPSLTQAQLAYGTASTERPNQKFPEPVFILSGTNPKMKD